jgi:hypothetical protein
VLMAVDAALAQGLAPTCYRRVVRRAA